MSRKRFADNLVPDEVFDHIQDITPEWLLARGVRGLAVDLDNTLAFYRQSKPQPEVISWVRRMADGGIPVVIVSNGSEKRVMSFCEPLGVPYVFRAGKPRRDGYHKAIRVFALPPGSIAQLGDQVFTDVWGAKRCGMVAILVRPLRLKGHILFSLRRMLESPFIREAIRRKRNPA
ncbi:MAG: YqeG family HAD IIIA-type phosphatase [Oscillospiraceae bacterium]|nr:YqeG family HAD IIIA-type phosphatase [Oscillospiraceae bacterium]